MNTEKLITVAVWAGLFVIAFETIRQVFSSNPLNDPSVAAGTGEDLADYVNYLNGASLYSSPGALAAAGLSPNLVGAFSTQKGLTDATIAQASASPDPSQTWPY